MLHCLHFDLQARLGCPLAVDDIRYLGHNLWSCAREPAVRATAPDKVVETFRLLYVMLEEILSLNEEEERLRQHIRVTLGQRVESRAAKTD